MDTATNIVSETSNSLWFGVGIAAIGLIGGAFLYSKTSPSPARLVDYVPTKQPPRLSKQTYEFCNNILDEVDDDEEETFPALLILHQTPRGRLTPCIAPFALKLETFLRVYEINYEVDFESKVPTNPESAWITLQYEDVIDSQNAIEYIRDTYEIDPDHHVANKDHAVSRAFNSMLEHHLYWGIMLDRYVYNDYENLRKIQFLPPQSQVNLPKIVHAMTMAVWFHGIGKIDPQVVSDSMVRDIEALSALLGDKDYFLGQIYPSELDCTAFAMLAQILWTMPHTRYYNTIRDRCPNLKTFAWRMRTTYWSDWDACLHNVSWDSNNNC